MELIVREDMQMRKWWGDGMMKPIVRNEKSDKVERKVRKIDLVIYVLSEKIVYDDAGG